ncbi:hypothetical protein RD1_3779 [Roseobacter denitrificans OCh 114]|uniref:Uncharacterized protein n=1 Tax=Roseobacter denitrificans (strain ATCC 33942 / OCh 114) TaxID=375451 RepID=Q161U6_ROSDO|nr:hypothetical protein RD1_3779 [Roseobacter denitrificans OCh 114]
MIWIKARALSACVPLEAETEGHQDTWIMDRISQKLFLG